MTHPTSRPTTRPVTRRGALAGAAWTVPVVVVAGAVPAYAASPSSSLTLVRGATTAVEENDGTDTFYSLRLQGSAVVVPGSVPAGGLTVTATFSPASAGGPSGLVVLDDAPSAPWTIALVGSSVVLTYGAAVPGGGTAVDLPNGILLGAERPVGQQRGTFVLTAAVTGFTSSSQGFSTDVLGARVSGRGRRR